MLTATNSTKIRMKISGKKPGARATEIRQALNQSRATLGIPLRYVACFLKEPASQTCIFSHFSTPIIPFNQKVFQATRATKITARSTVNQINFTLWGLCLAKAV